MSRPQNGHAFAWTEFFTERVIGWSFMTTRCQSKTGQTEPRQTGERGIHSWPEVLATLLGRLGFVK